ncbi:MAG: single-stranded DNA-binding protein [Patescibacteria group bacterium]
MASRSLNKVLLIGNLTRDPELRYTPSGSAVCTVGLATNRSWTTEDGEKKETAEFHTIIAWNRLAEICAEYLKKGSQVYVEGRLSTRDWEAQDGTKRRTTEIIANEIIFLSGGGAGRTVSHSSEDIDIPADFGTSEPAKAEKVKSETKKVKGESKEEVNEDDIPF